MEERPWSSDAEYFQWELSKARPPLGVEEEPWWEGGGYRLKVTGYADKGSRWLTLTPEQFDKLFALMTREDFHGEQHDKLTPGTKVIKGGYPGTVVREYLPDMYEVRLDSGVVVVPVQELDRP